jgi:hypothetical protein
MKRLLLALLFVACTAEKPAPPPAAEAPKTPPPPSAEQARELIANAPEFGDYQFTNASVSIARRDANAEALAKAGWIHFDASGNVALSPKAQTDKRFLLRQNGILDVVPLAKKELVAVTAVRGADVEFTWKWVPNEIGTLFPDKFAGERKNTATLLWDGANWIVLRIA